MVWQLAQMVPVPLAPFTGGLQRRCTGLPRLLLRAPPPAPACSGASSQDSGKSYLFMSYLPAAACRDSFSACCAGQLMWGTPGFLRQPQLLCRKIPARRWVQPLYHDSTQAARASHACLLNKRWIVRVRQRHFTAGVFWAADQGAGRTRRCARRRRTGSAWGWARAAPPAGCF